LKVAAARNDFKVLIAGGGTGGHVIPALAIARELRDAHGAEVRFVGTARGLETRLVPESGFALELIQVGQLKNVSLATRLKTLGDLPRGVAKCLSLLSTFQPDVVVGVGGYASGPAMLAAVLRRVPTLAFEPNAAPGLANRLIGRLVSAAAINFPETAHQFRNAKVTGIPVRPEFFAIAPHIAGGAQRLLVMGGSQGARALNEALPKVAKALLDAVPMLTIEHQCGARHVQATEDAYAQSGADAGRFLVSGFLSNAAEAIAEADLLLCRSGASTVAELCAAGRPALYVPFPQAADDHQRRNAEAMVAAGAADLLPESQMSADDLLPKLVSLLRAPDRLNQMGMHARSVAKPDAIVEIAAMVLALRSR
jgi:UDP-N-acetylglucosamine--N-acetylmuramyl-(pentapeptide) pyrophosphoryl-undecaprenol N-acetylglucosamine transferase